MQPALGNLFQIKNGKQGKSFPPSLHLLPFLCLITAKRVCLSLEVYLTPPFLSLLEMQRFHQACSRSVSTWLWKRFMKYAQERPRDHFCHLDAVRIGVQYLQPLHAADTTQRNIALPLCKHVLRCSSHLVKLAAVIVKMPFCTVMLDAQLQDQK